MTALFIDTISLRDLLLQFFLQYSMESFSYLGALDFLQIFHVTVSEID